MFVHAFDKDSVHPKLTIDFTIVDAHLQVKITDNGKGITKKASTEKHVSKGVKMVEERLKLLNNGAEDTILINSNDQGGTTVLINMHSQSHSEYLRSQHDEKVIAMMN